MASSNRLVFCLVSIVMVLVLALAAAVGVLVWRFATVADALEDFEDGCREGGITECFPGYFRNAEQQSLFLAQFYNETRPLRTYSPKNCTFYCPDETILPPDSNNTDNTPLFTGRRRRDVSSVETHRQVALVSDSLERTKRDLPDGATILFGPVYHACCQSWRIITAPATAETLYGEEVELVQGVAGFSQYFDSEYVEAEPSCVNCECHQPVPFVYSAVYYKDKNARSFRKKYDITEIKLPGCCKCLNI